MKFELKGQPQGWVSKDIIPSHHQHDRVEGGEIQVYGIHGRRTEVSEDVYRLTMAKHGHRSRCEKRYLRSG